MKLDLLAFGAHPDDVEAGCGGFLIKYAQQGKKVGIVDLSLAELSTNGTIPVRMEEAKNAAHIIGAVVRENLEFPNNFFVNSKENQEKIINVIRKYKPEIVLLPYWNDRHPDHAASRDIIFPALFTAGLKNFISGASLPHRPKYVFFYQLWYGFTPTFILDISKEFPVKIDAILAYQSQFVKKEGSIDTKDTNPAFLKYIEARHRNSGYEIGVEYGEAYASATPLGIKDMQSLLPNYD